MSSKKVVAGKQIAVGIRKILTVGNSIGIILPREFLVKNKISVGDEICLVWNGDLRVIPHHTATQEER